MRVEAPSQSGADVRVAGADQDTATVLAAAGDLAYDFAELGSTRVEGELVRFVREARRHGADALLGSIVLDRSESDVARQRAFGTMLQQVARKIREA